MRLVLLTRDDYEHRYVANKLAEEHPLTAIIIDRGKPQAKFARVRALLRRYTLRQLFSRAVGKAITILSRGEKHRRAQMFKVLGRENCERHLQRHLIKYVDGLNTANGLETIRKLQPDVILVYGTGVVGNNILEIALKGAINMHTGISPYYRGTNCAFWPLYNEELHMLGATVHQCTSQIDGGQIYAVSRATLHPEDDMPSVFARCVEVGTRLYIQVIRDLLGGCLKGKSQQLDRGREYCAAMKSWRKEWKVRRKIKKGLIRNYLARHAAEIPAVGRV